MPQVQESCAHVGQPAPSPHEGATTPGRSEPPKAARTDRHRKFATMLGARSRGDEEAAGHRAAGGAPATLPIDRSPEASGVRELARPPVALEAPHRLLLDDSPACDSALLRIEGGRFAGTEIHLALTGSHVEVSVLTPHEASRQTLAIAMEAVRNRLRARGLTMVDAPGKSSRLPRRHSPAGGERTGPTGSGDGDASDR